MSDQIAPSSTCELDDYPYDLGAYHRPVTTTDQDAQKWFNRGLVWCYGFNHEEAIACFRTALEHDHDCSMAYWALAYASGPNYNKPWDFFDDQDFAKTIEDVNHAAIQAKAKSTSAFPVEKALIEALQYRYPPFQDAGDRDFKAWNQNYADKMRKVYNNFPEDLDVAALFADALMNVTPWGLWELTTGKPASGAHTLEAKDVLDRALTQPASNKHPGLLHLYIHLMEMSSTPEAALPKANLLRGLVPDSGHLNHMPTHLDILCGDYETAAIWNLEAIKADEKFLSRAGPVNFYTLYRSHDYHFRIYASMFAGKSKIALETVAELESSIPEKLLRVSSPPMADWLEGFLPMRVHVLIRFGLWDQLVSMSIPHDQDLFCVTTATIHYGKGIAFSATGRVEEAKLESEKFRNAVKRVPASRMLFNNRCVDVLKIAEAMLDGELEYRRGNLDVAFKHLERSVELDDNLPYDEPWGWMQPTRHAYGALLLEQGRFSEAEKLFKADLGLDNTLPRALQHPNNVWSLHGYHECLLKQSRRFEAPDIKARLEKALNVADVPVKSSCFCRRQTQKAL